MRKEAAGQRAKEYSPFRVRGKEKHEKENVGSRRRRKVHGTPEAKERGH